MVYCSNEHFLQCFPICTSTHNANNHFCGKVIQMSLNIAQKESSTVSFDKISIDDIYIVAELKNLNTKEKFNKPLTLQQLQELKSSSIYVAKVLESTITSKNRLSLQATYEINSELKHWYVEKSSEQEDRIDKEQNIEYVLSIKVFMNTNILLKTKRKNNRNNKQKDRQEIIFYPVSSMNSNTFHLSETNNNTISNANIIDIPLLSSAPITETNLNISSEKENHEHQIKQNEENIFEIFMKVLESDINHCIIKERNSKLSLKECHFNDEKDAELILNFYSLLNQYHHSTLKPTLNTSTFNSIVKDKLKTKLDLDLNTTDMLHFLYNNDANMSTFFNLVETKLQPSEFDCDGLLTSYSNRYNRMHSNYTETSLEKAILCIQAHYDSVIKDRNSTMIPQINNNTIATINDNKEQDSTSTSFLSSSNINKMKLQQEKNIYSNKLEKR